MTCTPFLRQKSKNGGAIFMEFKYSYEEKIKAKVQLDLENLQRTTVDILESIL